MKILLSQKIKEQCNLDNGLLYRVRGLQNGANIHCVSNIVSTYINACQLLNEGSSHYEKLKEIHDRSKEKLNRFIARRGVC